MRRGNYDTSLAYCRKRPGKNKLNKLLISNARLINEGEIREVDVLVHGERIEKIDAQIAVDDSVEVIDADGRYLMPGMIDDQVHFREPGLTHKADFATESRAAAAGGVTSFMDMPNVDPQTTNPGRAGTQIPGRC